MRFLLGERWGWYAEDLAGHARVASKSPWKTERDLECRDNLVRLGSLGEVRSTLVMLVST